MAQYTTVSSKLFNLFWRIFNMNETVKAMKKETEEMMEELKATLYPLMANSIDFDDDEDIAMVRAAKKVVGKSEALIDLSYELMDEQIKREEELTKAMEAVKREQERTNRILIGIHEALKNKAE